MSALVLDVSETFAMRERLDSPPNIDRTKHVMAAAQAGLRSLGLSRALWRAARGPGRLTADEYFYYQLYDTRFDDDARSRFVGKRVQHQLHVACNDFKWYAPSDDKCLFYALMAAHGLRAPQTRAVYTEQPRSAAFKTLRSAADLRAFLADPANYPVFAKPLAGRFSLGAMDLERLEGDEIVARTGDRAPIDQMAAFMADARHGGYLLQDRMIASDALRPALGSAPPSIRFLVLTGPEGPRIESAVLKIAVGDNMADNYWRAGNMLGAIDLDSGALTRVVSGAGADLQTHDAHPKTGAALTGTHLPDWRAAQALCLEAAAIFPPIRTQSWDVALTDQGPSLIEFNFGGDLNLHQLPHDRGALQPGYVEHLRRCGYKGKLPA